MLKKRHSLTFLFIFFVSITCTTYSQGNESSSTNYLPIVFYTPETDFGFGGLVGYNFYNEEPGETNFPSTIMSNIIYTLNRQMITELFTDIYWKNGTYHFQGRLSYQYFPDKFYGIGNSTKLSNEESFVKKTYDANFLITKKLFDKVDAGILYNLGYHNIVDYDSEGNLVAKNIPGSDEGWLSGTGLIFSLDTRDNKFYPSSGNFINLTYTYFGNELGSAFQFNHYLLDYRKYFSVTDDHILALSGTIDAVSGIPPFQAMPSLGGQNHLRGYYQGRFRDKNSLVIQSEYRMRVWNRFGVVLFAGIGDVSDSIGNFKLNTFKHSVGAGLRYTLNEKEKINIRLDFGFVDEGSGIYITLNEAF